ncbi:hypothetical protein IIA94_01000 [Patescibacteria group bacterium]|nr:hypothetical protein [Patescibacteria group bacterium]
MNLVSLVIFAISIIVSASFYFGQAHEQREELKNAMKDADIQGIREELAEMKGRQEMLILYDIKYGKYLTDFREHDRLE